MLQQQGTSKSQICFSRLGHNKPLFSRLKAPTSGYYASSQLLFLMAGNAALSVSGDTNFEGTVPIQIDSGTVSLRELRLSNYGGATDNGPSVSIRPAFPTSTSAVYLGGNITMAVRTSGGYDPDFVVEADFIICNAVKMAIPDFRYVRFTSRNVVSWGGTTISISRAFGRFQLQIPSQEISAFPAITITNPIGTISGAYAKMNAVVVWGPARGCGSEGCPLILDAAPAGGSQIGEAWLVLYGTLSVSTNPTLAGLFLFSGASVQSTTPVSTSAFPEAAEFSSN